MRALLALVTALLLLGGVAPVRPLPCACTAERNCGCRCFARAAPGDAAHTDGASCCSGPRVAACAAPHGANDSAAPHRGHGSVRIDAALRAAEPRADRVSVRSAWAAPARDPSSWTLEPRIRPPEFSS